MTWKQAWQVKPFKTQLIGIILLLLIFLFSVPWYFTKIVEQRPGAILNDFLLNWFPPADHSILIFIVLYCAIGQSLISLATKPKQLLLCLTAYCAMNYLRVLTLWIFPLCTRFNR